MCCEKKRTQGLVIPRPSKVTMRHDNREMRLVKQAEVKSDEERIIDKTSSVMRKSIDSIEMRVGSRFIWVISAKFLGRIS